MNEDLHNHLDGDLDRGSLDEAIRREADSWNTLLDAFRQAMPPSFAPDWLEDRVMAEIEALPQPGLVRRGIGWALRPRQVRVSPLAAGLAAAAVVALLLFRGFLPGLSPGAQGTMGPGEVVEGPAPGGASAAGSEMVVYVQFALEAPGAASVAVAGDFDGWEGTNVLEDLDGDGIWTGRVPVRPGVYAYMFLVDGSEWITDPRADRYADDGFGNRNAVLAVAAPVT